VDPDVRVPLLERLQFVEVAQDGPWPGDLLAADAVLGRDRDLVVGPLVTQSADHVARTVRYGVRERVVDDGQLPGRPVLHEVADEEAPAVDPPRDVVADDFPMAGLATPPRVVLGLLRRDHRRGRTDRDQHG
jgi:hypothetical protein